MEQHAPTSALPNSSSELVLSEGMRVTCGHMMRDRHLLLFRRDNNVSSETTMSLSCPMRLHPASVAVPMGQSCTGAHTCQEAGEQCSRMVFVLSSCSSRAVKELWVDIILR